MLARPGDWWRDRAAAFADKEQTKRCMGDLCLEVVHLAVHPRAQGCGLGKLAHDLLIAGSPASTAILACDPVTEPDYHLYSTRAWSALAEVSMPAAAPASLS